MATATNTIKRTYGKERAIGDIFYTPSTKSVWCSIGLGFLGKINLTLIQDKANGGYEIIKPYKDKQGNEQVVKLGKTFVVKDKDGNVVTGLSKGTLGLLKEYDSVAKKELTKSEDCLIITTHKLKENKIINEDLIKVGWLTGQFGIEVIEKKVDAQNGNNIATARQEYVPEYEINEDEIPF